MRHAVWNTAQTQGVRHAQEDMVLVRSGDPTSAERHPVAVVCDGIGGHGHGDTAAVTAANAFLTMYETATRGGEAIATALRKGVDAANDAIRDTIRKNRQLTNMGTTLSAAAVTASGVEWINVGDSPIYVYKARTERLEEIGIRHNLPGAANRLISAVTGTEIAEMSASPRPLALDPGDIVLVASDGINTLKTDAIEQACVRESKKSEHMLGALLEELIVETADKSQDNATFATLLATRALPRRRAANARFAGRRVNGKAKVTIENKPLDWWRSLKLYNHSPTGPEWGDYIRKCRHWRRAGGGGLPARRRAIPRRPGRG